MDKFNDRGIFEQRVIHLNGTPYSVTVLYTAFPIKWDYIPGDLTQYTLITADDDDDTTYLITDNDTEFINDKEFVGTILVPTISVSTSHKLIKLGSHVTMDYTGTFNSINGYIAEYLD